jgi:CheY-like chemotaxis protein
MFDLLQIACHRFRKARTLESALKQLVAAKLVNEAKTKEMRPCDLLVHLAQVGKFDLSLLLEEVAGRLGLPSTRELWLPSAALIAETGHNADFLQTVPALPQPSVTAPAGWALVVANPELISISEYEAIGVDVLLGLAQDIEAIWQKRRQLLNDNVGSEVTEERVFAVIEQLAVDAAQFGAREVFIGHPDSSRYEFLAGEKRYAGSISSELYRTVLDLFVNEHNLRHPVVSPRITDLNLALTKNFSHPVVYLSWNRVEDQDGNSEQQQDRHESTKEDEAGCCSGQACVHEVVGQVNGGEGSNPIPGGAQRVLLVDDDPRFCSILKHILERKGYEVSQCGDGENALLLLNNGNAKPNVIICDIHMPRADGAMFLRQLRYMGSKLPVLMVTSDEDRLLEMELVELGADAYVRKQEDIGVLLAWCKNLSSRKKNVGDYESNI